MMSQEDIVPMTMASFFEASRGTWLNRRVVHHLDCQDDEAADSNLIIEPFDQHDPAIAKVFLNNGALQSQPPGPAM